MAFPGTFYVGGRDISAAKVIQENKYLKVLCTNVYHQ